MCGREGSATPECVWGRAKDRQDEEGWTGEEKPVGLVGTSGVEDAVLFLPPTQDYVQRVSVYISGEMGVQVGEDI